MKKVIFKSKGFTLIELLVVIAIIALLSTTVLASVKTARLKALDAAVRQELRQLANLAALNQLDYNNYAALSDARWNTTTADCNLTFPTNSSNKYVVQANAICVKIISLKSALQTGNGAGLVPPDSVDVTKFSFMSPLPSNENITYLPFYCVGSSGSSIETSSYFFTSTGCYRNP